MGGGCEPWCHSRDLHGVGGGVGGGCRGGGDNRAEVALQEGAHGGHSSQGMGVVSSPSPTAMLISCMAVRKMAVTTNCVLYWRGGGHPTAALQCFAHHMNCLGACLMECDATTTTLLDQGFA